MNLIKKYFGRVGIKWRKKAKKALGPNVPKYTVAVISFVHTVEYERAIFAGRLKVPQTYRMLALLSSILRL